MLAVNLIIGLDCAFETTSHNFIKERVRIVES